MEPIWNERLLQVEDNIVVADLHIGYERELEEKGINIPDQSKETIKSVFKVLEKKGADKLIINGDFKHNIPKATWQEYRDIPKAVDEWLKVVDEIHLIPGNHDGGIEKYLPSDVIVHDPSGAILDDTGFFHGHAIPSEEVLSTGEVVLAHSHPAVELTDSFKNKEKKECWVRLEYESEENEGEAIVMPNYNPLLGGIKINVKEDAYLGPFLRNNRLSEEEVYLLDGTFLGERKDLIEDRNGDRYSDR
ncbi:MAG: metallophosphoesterase [Candidatus Thermoplasmatota archaeon]|nr:metallophosphoesterase [Candidatus Thermoplasmatota archaeon]